jgi:choline kinase
MVYQTSEFITINYDLANKIEEFEKILIKNCFLIPISRRSRRYRIVETGEEIRFFQDKIYITKDFLDLFDRCPNDVKEELVYHFGLLMSKSVLVEKKYL